MSSNENAQGIIAGLSVALAAAVAEAVRRALASRARADRFERELWYRSGTLAGRRAATESAGWLHGPGGEHIEETARSEENRAVTALRPAQ